MPLLVQGGSLVVTATWLVLNSLCSVSDSSAEVGRYETAKTKLRTTDSLGELMWWTLKPVIPSHASPADCQRHSTFGKHTGMQFNPEKTLEAITHGHSNPAS